MLPRVHVIATGGTIAGGATGSLDAAKITALVPGISLIAHIELEDFVAIPSSRMTPEIQFRLAKRVNELFAAESDLSGIVITHGTDSLEETAFFLDLLISDERLVVFTAAQRPPRMQDSDGPRNLLNAVTIAASDALRGFGVVVTLNDEIHAAREVRKTHATALEAFQSPASGPVGYIDEGGLFVIARPLRRVTLAVETIEPAVEVIPLAAGGDGHLIDAAVAAGAKGIVVEVFGRGNVPDNVQVSIRKAIQSEVAVVFVTRTGEGRVILYPPFNTMGVLSGEDLDALKARVLLIAALAEPMVRKNLPLYLAALAGSAKP